VAGALTPEDWNRLESLVDRLLDTAPESRAAILAELTGGDAARQAQLRELLQEAELGLPFLDRPATERFDALLAPAAARFPESLGSRYRVIRELGSGGMATVFLALDQKHGREVAVKVMRPDLTRSLGRERFLREIGIAARLRHPNIVPLFDSGEADGSLFYVMPYEAGHSLRERLTREPRLPVDEAVRILRDVAEALAHAHQQGVIHRDIKPDNVLLAGRRALVTDFGIARAVSAAAEQSELTTARGIPGTPAYMPPEAGGGAGTGPRLDVYAFGVMAFEMLAGERPFGPESPASHAGDATGIRRRLSALRPEVPEAVVALVATCLAPRPDDRYPSATEVMAAIEKLEGVRARGPRWSRRPVVRRFAAIGVPVLIAGLAWYFRPSGREATLATSLPRLAVLVFQHGRNPRLEPVAVGLTDNLIGALGGVPGLVVRSLPAVMPYRDSVLSPRDLGRRLDVTWLVGGHLYQVGERTTASVQLTEASTGRLIARTEASAAAGEDVRLIEDIVVRVATMLRERVGEEVRLRDWRAGTRSDAAFAALNRAQQVIREGDRLAELRDLPGAWQLYRRADLLLDSAARADPRWPEPSTQRAALALTLARTLYGSGHATDSISDVLRRGADHATAALRLDPARSRAKELLGLLLYQMAGTPGSDSAAERLATAERLLHEVSTADTTLVDGLTVLSGLLFGRGEYERAYVLAERAYRADAYFSNPQVVLSRLFTYSFEAEEDGEADGWCRRYAARFPDDWFTSYCQMTLMTWAPGIPPDTVVAAALAARGAQSTPRVIRPGVTAQLQTLMAGVYARAGANTTARRILDDVRDFLTAEPAAGREPFGSVRLEFEAGAQAKLGNPDSASRLLREIIKRQPEQAVRLRGSRRFRELAIDSLTAGGASPR
jgi:TolB-like protein